VSILLGLGAVVAGVALLYISGDRIVTSSARVARTLGISPIVVGVVIVGFGTSAPELVASSIAALGGDYDLATGNILGSNTANLTLVLGATALVRVVDVEREQRRLEFPIVLATSALFALAIASGYAVWLTIVLFALFPLAMGASIRAAPARTDVLERLEDIESDRPATRKDTFLVLAGLVGLILGAQVMIRGAETLADEFNLTGGIVGFLIVALGTSLPELSASVSAAIRNEHGIVVGGLLGSNMFNSLIVGGTVAAISAGHEVPQELLIRGGASMGAATVAAWAISGGGRLGRRGGLLLLATYVGSLVFVATG
jgi:cation:H+ antiporter